MDMKFRQFLLLLLDDLSDVDRCRLQFVLGKHIPRRLRESNSIENTLQIFEHLIDNGQIFTCLIEALSACGRIDLSEKLKNFETTCSMSITHPHQQSYKEMTITQLTLDDTADDEEDSGFSFFKIFSKSRCLFNLPHFVTFHFDKATPEKSR
ncbi:unnamed protein product [Rotaria sp. Silwood2]|nr:unnamed protein product [Rotaria sp. Silwood2]CAF2523764.1 unnamed protein product [Rotaria sp. Silwood2]CAF2769771.1 unnamed protein product [Rotaria sp. Silwood2]CAF2945619.1 unnamed protein product [Rotaria sp. Silwood2]CAF3917565.1 unnamed protein product [Rotaria sp. Silwood2]